MAGKKSTPAAPAAPDPNAVARAQTGSNVQTAIANTHLSNINEDGPLGSVRYTIEGYEDVPGGGSGGTGGSSDGWGGGTGGATGGTTYKVPKYKRTTTMSPEQQRLYDQQVGLGSKMNTAAGQQLDRVSSTLNAPLDDSDINYGPSSIRGSLPGLYGVTDWAGRISSSFDDVGGPDRDVSMDMAATDFGYSPDMFSGDRKRVEDAMYARLNPHLERSRNELEQRLVNQGLARGSAAFNEAMDEARRQENDARLGVTVAGGAEQSRLYGMAKGAGEFRNSAVGQNNAARLSTGTFRNAAQEQAFGQAMQRTGFYNDTVQKAAALEAQARGFNNKVAQDTFNNEKTAAEFEGTAGDRAFQRRVAKRNQPINEIGALMSGGQVSMPTFAQFRPGNVAETPVGQYMYQTAGQNQDAWRTQMAADASTRAGLYNLAGSVLGAGITRKWG